MTISLKTTIAAAAFVLSMGATPALAEMTTTEFLRMYDDGNQEDRNLLEFIIDGNANGMDWLNSFNIETRGEAASAYCAPPDEAHDANMVIAIIRDGVSRNPAIGDMPYGAGVLLSYIEVYPCP